MDATRIYARRCAATSPWPRLIVLAAALLAVGSTGALAEAGSNEFERGTKDVFSISLGSFLMDFDTKARLDSLEYGIGTELDAEDDLGLDNGQTRVRLDGYWRFARKHRLEFAYYYFGKDSERFADEEIQWGDRVFDLSAGLRAKSSMDIFKLAYKWSFVRNEKWDAGLSVGISTMSTKLELEGEVTVDGTSAGFARESSDVVAPIPLIGIHAEWKFADKWYLKGSGEYLNISVSDWEGSAKDGRVTVNWYPWTHWGFGAGYNIVELEYDDTSQPSYRFDYSYEGLLLYATYVY